MLNFHKAPFTATGLLITVVGVYVGPICIYVVYNHYAVLVYDWVDVCVSDTEKEREGTEKNRKMTICFITLAGSWISSMVQCHL